MDVAEIFGLGSRQVHHVVAEVVARQERLARRLKGRGLALVTVVASVVVVVVVVGRIDAVRDVVDLVLVPLRLILDSINFAVQSIELVLAHRLTAIFILEDDATLPAEGSLPLTPRLLGLGLRILVGLHDSLEAASHRPRPVLHLASAHVGAGGELMDVPARLGDVVGEGLHVNRLGATTVSWVESLILLELVLWGALSCRQHCTIASTLESRDLSVVRYQHNGNCN
mmetsp:Transcript_41388/g.130254  ORF Transcript_41388/g.130254 Transcript_41388/m.130254 type:complete len:227 (-) Transcript_41388:107-787(-)